MKKPLCLSPAFKDYLWGGTRLREEFFKDCDFEKVAESWELSCHKDGMTTILGGEFDGMSLEAVLQKEGWLESLGTHAERFENFPVLVKLIDAKQQLSVQVHPDDAYALEREGEYGKTEMWYIVDCEAGAELLYGFEKEISAEAFQKAIEENTLLDVVHHAEVHKGDVFFIPAGTLHAIGKGILIAEIQQNSNTTYRVYDYGRLGADGKPRELHVAKALEVTKRCPAEHGAKPEPMIYEGYRESVLASCEKFIAKKLEISTEANRMVGKESFEHLLVTEGSCVLKTQSEDIFLKRGAGVFLPADLGEYKLEGQAEVIVTSI